MDELELRAAVEAILFASGDPVGVDRLALILDADRGAVLDAARDLAAGYEAGRRGIRLVFLADALQLHSAPEYAEPIARALEQRRPPRLSQASLEVLAVVAYFQPVTRAYIEQMRGLDSGYTVGVLVDRGLIEPCGHLETVGRPTLFRTTDLFLRSMGISSLDALPPLPEIAGSDAVLKLQAQVDALRGAGGAGEAPEENGGAGPEEAAAAEAGPPPEETAAAGKTDAGTAADTGGAGE